MYDVSKQEWMILEALWENSPLYLADIMQALEGKLNWTHSTYLSYIRKMVEREYVGFQKVRGNRAYFAIAQQEECVEYQSNALLFMMRNKSAVMLINDLLAKTPMDEQAISRLAAALDAKEPTPPEEEPAPQE